MIPEQYRQMIDKITDMTKERAIEWETTSDKLKFELEIEDNSIIILKYSDFESGIPIIGFEIRDDYGDLVDGMYISSDDIDYETMDNLFSEARRNAMKIENTISNIMSILKKREKN